MWRWLPLLVLLLLASSEAFGRDRVTWRAVWIDHSGQAGIDEAATKLVDVDGTPQALPPGAAAWVSAEIEGAGVPGDWRVVEMWGWPTWTAYSRAAGTWEARHSGAEVPLAARDVRVIGRVEAAMARVRVDDDGRLRVVIRIPPHPAVTRTVPSGAWLNDPAALIAKDQRLRWAQGAFLGAMLVLILYNALLWWQIREPAYHWYVVGLFGLLLIWGGNFGLLFELLPWLPTSWIYHTFFVGAVLGTVGTLQFARHFLQTWVGAPRFDRALKAICAISLVHLLHPWLPDALKWRLADYFVAVVYLAALAAAVLALRQKHPVRGYFALAYIVLSVGNLAWVALNASGHRDVWPWSIEVAQVAVLAEGILLSLALAARFKHLQRERQSLLELQGAALAGEVADRTRELAAEKARSEALLANILPASIAEELKRDGRSLPRRHEDCTVLFADLAGFTETTASMPPDRLVRDLDELFQAFDEVMAEHGVEKIKTIGDAYLAVAGLTHAHEDHALSAVKAALAMQQVMAARNLDASIKWGLRVGLHSGPVVAGVVGRQKFAYDIWGDTVNLAHRLESASEAGEINVSAYTWDLVRAHCRGRYRGKVGTKGKGELDMYFVDAISDNTSSTR